MEPLVRCKAGLFCPDTGIVDVHELMTTLVGDFERADGILLCNAAVERIRPTSDGFCVGVLSDRVPAEIVSRTVVNSAGLSAAGLCHRIDGYPADRIPVTHFAKGNYFACSAKPFRHLVYPMPNEAGLGVHATLDVDGSVRFGPDVEWVHSTDYDVDIRRAVQFYDAIREYWPSLPADSLNPAYSGIRPKISGPGEAPADFLISGPEDHGLAGLVNLIGIESPGLTAALAIADYVCGALYPQTLMT